MSLHSGSVAKSISALSLLLGVLASTTVLAEGYEGRPWGRIQNRPQAMQQEQGESKRRYNPWAQMRDLLQQEKGAEQSSGVDEVPRFVRKSKPQPLNRPLPQPPLGVMPGYGAYAPVPLWGNPSGYAYPNIGSGYWTDPYRPMLPAGGFTPWGNGLW